jgi:hypothetical protein
MKLNWLVLAAVVLCASTAWGEVLYDAGPGSGASSGMLGGHTMTSFPLDERPVFEDVASVPSPLGGELGFSIPMSHRRIGSGWGTWSHGYSGDVYYSNGQTGVTLAMPPDTAAFEFYVEPNPFSLQSFTAVSDDGTSSGVFTAHGSSGATYVGFYGTDGSVISSIALSGSSDFSVGEFAIAAVPEPGAFVLSAFACLALLRRR